jgi:hypothetical protein
MNLQPGVGNICYVLDGGEPAMTGAKTDANDSLEQPTKSLPTRRPYPGATLKHLGSVRDVTLIHKTTTGSDGLGHKNVPP